MATLDSMSPVLHTSVRETVAHAATPWEWRSRGAVVALVAISVVLTTVGIVMQWVNDRGSNRLVAVILYGGLGLLLLVWPAIRSLRRWDNRHRVPEW